MNDHFDEMRVPPDHSQAEALRQRLHARMASVSQDNHHGRPLLHLDTEHLDPDELDPMQEINVSLNTPTSEATNRRRQLMAAAAVIVVIGVAGISLTNNNTDDDLTPSPAVATVAPTTTVAPTKIVRFAVTSANIPVTFTAPVDWTVTEGFEAYKRGGGAVWIYFDEIANIYADGCQWLTVDPPVGPTVDDLVAAWANVPDVAATAAVPVTVDGYDGKQIEFTVPDYKPGECKGNQFALWYAPGENAPGFWAQGPNANQHTQQRILDVDGTRLVITAFYFPSTSPQDRAALEEALASIQIG